METYHFPTKLGGNLALDYTNTIEHRDSPRCLDYLRSYDHVLAWSECSARLDHAEAARLERLAAQHPAQADAAFRGALDLRDALYRIFTAVIAASQPAAADLARLNDALASAQRRIESGGSGFAWAWTPSDDLTSILAPVALAAAELLTSDPLQWVRQCPNCGWLFVDTSRNHSRRWCSMDVCGSQVKSRRQYERRKMKA